MQYSVMVLSVLANGYPHRFILGSSKSREGAQRIMYAAIGQQCEHFVSHSNGNHVGVASQGNGWIVQMFAPNGEVEAWREYEIVRVG
jgi:hypothetical protein